MFTYSSLYYIGFEAQCCGTVTLLSRWKKMWRNSTVNACMLLETKIGLPLKIRLMHQIGYIMDSSCSSGLNNIVVHYSWTKPCTPVRQKSQWIQKGAALHDILLCITKSNPRQGYVPQNVPPKRHLDHKKNHRSSFPVLFKVHHMAKTYLQKMNFNKQGYNFVEFWMKIDHSS